MSSPDASDQPPPPQSAEDRKAASALAALDTPADSSASPSANIDQEAVSKAMLSLGSGAGAATKPAASPAAGAASAAKKNVKVDPADVALCVDQLEISKAKATELLKAHDGDAVMALRSWARG